MQRESKEATGAKNRLFSLYVHIPFCLRKCPYCDFNSVAVPSIPEREYLAALELELQTYGAREPWAGRKVSTVYFGGGTPSLLQPAIYSELLECIDRLFGIEVGAEITLEANPASTSSGKYRRLLAAGINRLSIGAQSFDAKALKTLGRLHVPDETISTINEVARSGFTNIGIDLIFGLPQQSLSGWEQDLRRCLEIAPSHVSTYELTIEPGTEFYALQRSHELVKPSQDTLAEMYAMARALLTSSGYHHYEVSNFARRGKESRHNLAYWRGHPYLGIGAGAHSFDPTTGWGRRWSNERNFALYIDRITGSGAAVAHSEELSTEQAICEFLLLGLRLLEGIDPHLFEARFKNPLETLLGETTNLIAEGMLARRGEKIALTDRGLYLADSVLTRLMATQTDLTRTGQC